MALDTEAKRWSMLALCSGAVPSHVFNPDTSGLVSIEKITVLQKYGGITWDSPAGGPSAIFDFYYRTLLQSENM